MNERIQELKEQAIKYSLSLVNRDSEFFTQIAMERFSTLLLHECADWIDYQDESRCPYGIDLLVAFGVEE